MTLKFRKGYFDNYCGFFPENSFSNFLKRRIGLQTQNWAAKTKDRQLDKLTDEILANFKD
jgi:hypothetical protein